VRTPTKGKIILESNSSSLVLRPAGYSVALEKITNIIIEENKGLKPIKNKQLAQKFRKDLEEVLKSYEKEIREENDELSNSITILKKNIDKINNPTNRD
jgi:polyhydroxyalkanoate synthesis regulator phasin